MLVHLKLMEQTPVLWLLPQRNYQGENMVLKDSKFICVLTNIPHTFIQKVSG